MYNVATTLVSFFILAVTEDSHKSLGEFDFRPDPTSDLGVSFPLASGKIQIYL